MDIVGRSSSLSVCNPRGGVWIMDKRRTRHVTRIIRLKMHNND